MKKRAVGLVLAAGMLAGGAGAVAAASVTAVPQASVIWDASHSSTHVDASRPFMLYRG